MIAQTLLSYVVYVIPGVHSNRLDGLVLTAGAEQSASEAAIETRNSAMMLRVIDMVIFEYWVNLS